MAASRGDRRALERLLAGEQARLYAYSKSMCHHAADAEDVTQDTMLAVARHIHTFRGEASFSSWLFHIARSFCIKKRRRRLGQPATFEPLERARLPGGDAGPEAAVGRKEIGRILDEALRALPRDVREVIVLRDLEGLSAAEAAEVMGLSVGALKSKLHRARAALEAQLAPALGLSTGKRAKGSSCPDVLQLYSRKLEGELSPNLCKELEGHVASCVQCKGACQALKRSLAVCQRTPIVPRDVQERVRAAVRVVLDERHPRGRASRRA